MSEQSQDERLAEIRADIEDGRPYPWQTWRDRCAELLQIVSDHHAFRREVYEPQLAALRADGSSQATPKDEGSSREER